jgi:uncharacterized phage protein (TIGR02216 family)
MPETFPWARLMQIGIGVLGLSPAQFWRTTLREITAASGLAQSNQMSRCALERLMQQWPDTQPPADGFAVVSPAEG